MRVFVAAATGAELRDASDTEAKRELGRRPAHPGSRQGCAAA